MELESVKFNKSVYISFIDYLKSISDEKTRQFETRSFNSEKPILGIKVPVLRDIAKRISKGDRDGYFENCAFSCFEDAAIFGFLTATLKDRETVIRNINKLLLICDNWALCDLTMCSLKIMEKSRAEFFPFVQELLKSDKTFFVRAGIVALLSHYAIAEFADEIFNALDGATYGEYYVDMAAAWLVSVAYIKFPVQAEKYLLVSRMSDFAYNKGLSKIRDSYRVSAADKERIKGYFRKKR